MTPTPAPQGPEQLVEALLAEHRALRSWADGAKVDIEALQADLAAALADRDRLAEAVEDFHRGVMEPGFYIGGNDMAIRLQRLWTALATPQAPDLMERLLRSLDRAPTPNP